MLDSKLVEELDGLGDQVSVELVESLVDESDEVARNFFRFLQARSQSVSKGSNVRNMSVF